MNTVWESFGGRKRPSLAVMIVSITRFRIIFYDGSKKHVRRVQRCGPTDIDRTHNNKYLYKKELYFNTFARKYILSIAVKRAKSSTLCYYFLPGHGKVFTFLVVAKRFFLQA